jgi:TolB protein
VASVAIDSDDVIAGALPITDLFRIGADGSDTRQLTDDPALDGGAAWSPNGQQIAFGSWGDAGGGLFVMDADGGNLRRIADFAGDPVWSPAGRQIAVTSPHGYHGDYPQIYVVAADGSRQQRLTSFENVPTPTLSMGNNSPVWSPDGSEIAFISEQLDGPSVVPLMGADGSNVRQLADLPGRKAGVRWSSDGQLLAFATDTADADIWLVRPDGSELRNLTANPAVEVEFAWSPVAQELAFTRQSDGVIQLVVANADGSGERVLYDSPEFAMQLCWSPDGQRLAFIRGNPERNSDLFVINADGSGLQQLTATPDSETNPAWSPDGMTIVYAVEMDGGSDK